MKPRHIVRTPDFEKAYRRLPEQMQQIVESKITLLTGNPAHPSLKAHRMKRAQVDNVWACYINYHKRLIYQDDGETITLCDVGEHHLTERIHHRHF